MSCFNPRRVWITGINKNTGKKITKITSHDVKVCKHELGHRFLNPDTESYVVPCGQCIGCRMDYSKYWANRAYLESLEWKENYFITLTYEDENMPSDRSISKREVQLFLKRFRKLFNERYERYCLLNGFKYEYVKIRYVFSGEYGDSISFRPHYHAILFNCPFFDLDGIFEVKEKETGRIKRVPMYSKGVRLFHSKTLDDSWNNKGIATIASFSWNTAAYVARYVLKKLNGSKDLYSKLGINPPFMLTSRRPGIGYNYFMDHMNDIYQVDSIYTPKGMQETVSISKPGKYCDSLAERINPNSLKAIKEVRRYLAEHKKPVDSKLDDIQYLISSRNATEEKLKIFKKRCL